MELAAYAVMAAGAYVALITKERIVLYGWFALYVLYSLIVRLAPPIIDMEVYARALTLWPPPLRSTRFGSRSSGSAAPSCTGF